MRPITNEDIKILGRLVNISTEGVVADASQVYDSTQHKNQEVINSEMKNKTKNATTTTYGIVRLASGKNDADNTDVPTIKILRDAIQDAISFILEDPGNSLLDNLNSIKELADALNNDPSFWTWVRDQLALKADKSAFDTLVGRVDNLNQRVTYLEECCQQMHEYVNEFSVTWNQARGGNHVTITPGYVRIGNSVVEVNMDNGYVWEVDTTNASQLHTLLENCMDGDYDSFTITNVTRTAGFISGMTLNFSGVRSNITINGNVYKLGTITARSTGATISPVSKTWGNPVDGLRVLAFGVTAKSGYTTRGNTDWSLKDSSNVTVATGQYSNPNSDGSIIINIPETLQNITCFEDYTLEITIPTIPTYSVTYTYNTSQVNITNKPTSVPAGGTFSTSIAAKPGYIIGTIRTTMGGQPAYTYVDVGSTTQAISIPNVNGDITVEITSGSSTYSVTKNINHVTWSGPNGSDTTVSAEGLHTYDATVTPASGYQIDSLTVTVNGYDRTSNVYNSSTGRIYINAVIGNIVISGTTSQSGTTPTYGTVTISPDHGTASPSTFSADGTSHTITITPASGYTTTGMHATSTNSDVSVSVSGNTIIVTGTSSNNAAITVTLPAEGTTPSGPALSGSISASGSFNAFGRVEPLHYSQEDKLDVYDWGTSDPYSYGTQYVDINLGNISNFTGLQGSTNNDKLNDLKTKLNFDYYLAYGLNNGSVDYYDDGDVQDPIPSSGTTSTNTECPFSISDIVLDGSNVIVKVECLPADFSGGVTTETHTEGDGGNIEYGEDPQVHTTGARANGSTRQYIAGSRHETYLTITYSGDNSYACSRLVRNLYGINWPSMQQIYPAGSIVPGAQWYFNASLSYVAPECAFEAYDENSIDYTEGSGSLHHYTIGDANWAIYPTGTSNAVTLDSVEAKYQGNGAYYYRVRPADVLADGTYDLAMSYTSSNPSQYPSLTAKSIEGLTISSN